MATLETDSYDQSARPSLIPPGSGQDPNDFKHVQKSLTSGSEAKRLQAILDGNSYLESDILKRLRRELNDEVIDLEFDHKVC